METKRLVEKNWVIFIGKFFGSPGKSHFLRTRRPSKSTSKTQTWDQITWFSQHHNGDSQRDGGETLWLQSQEGQDLSETVTADQLIFKTSSDQQTVDLGNTAWQRIMRNSYHGCTGHGEQDRTSDMQLEVDTWRCRPPGDTCKGVYRRSSSKAQCNLVWPVFSKTHSDEVTKALERVCVVFTTKFEDRRTGVWTNLQNPLKITFLFIENYAHDDFIRSK